MKVQDGTLKFSFVVKNSGQVAGKVVPQAYWRLLNGLIAPPAKRLLRFKKIELLPGEARTLAYVVTVAEFRQLTPANKWVVTPASIEIQVGNNAETLELLKTRFTIN